MAEDKIPVTMEEHTDEAKASSDSEQQIAKPMEQLSIKTKPPTVHVKAVPKPNMHNDYLKEFDVFENHSQHTLPNANVPEKIILVIDRAQEENFTPFRADNVEFPPLSMLKRAIWLFITMKHTINKHHTFAIVILNENNAKWVLNFTGDKRKLKGAVDKMKMCNVEDTFNLNSLFEEINGNITLPDIVKPEIPPSYIIRTVIFYSRSYTIPNIQLNEAIKELLENPYFICDVLITHEPVGSDNNCRKIFTVLQELDKKGYTYFFPVGRDFKGLHNCTAKLLGHPLQRPIQKFQKI